MKLALFLGCVIPTEQYAYEVAVREVFPKLGIELIDMKGAGCCGCPLRGINALGWAYLSARDLALAEKMNLDVLTLCNSCHLSFCEIKNLFDEKPEVKDKVNFFLEKEGLRYNGNVKVKHVLDVLHDDVGVEKIAKSVKRPLKGFNFAAHYGCHALMPSGTGRIDDSCNPHKLEDLIEALGAQSEDYLERLDCCGGLAATAAEKMVAQMAWSKLRAVQDHGFDGMVTLCPFCTKMFDAKQEVVKKVVGDEKLSLPVLYYVQLLGYAMGIKKEKLGLDLNLSPVNRLFEKLEGADGK